jgi:queuine/archaeosine tRNA-ribosyltransferase
MLGVRLNTIHNLWYYRKLMETMRSAIQSGAFLSFRRNFYEQRRHYAKSASYAELVGVGDPMAAERSKKGKDG